MNNTLSGAQLDAWVAKAEGHKGQIDGVRFLIFERKDGLKLGPPGGGWHYSPSTIWAHGGPIIERERIAVWRAAQVWAAIAPDDGTMVYTGAHDYIDCDRVDGHIGDTPLIAAMREYVGSHFGDVHGDPALP